MPVTSRAGPRNIDHELFSRETRPGGQSPTELGVPRQYGHPELLRLMSHVLEVGKGYGVPVGHPHVDEKNVEQVVVRHLKQVAAEESFQVQWIRDR
jgi:hypothetical protein